VLTQNSGVAADEPTARYIVSLLRQLGFRGHLRVLTPDAWHAAIDDYHNPPQIGTVSWVADFPSPSQWIAKFLACAAWNPPTQLNNHARFCDHQADSLAQRAAQLEPTDPVAANQLWAQADRRITDLAPWIPTVCESEIDLLSRRAGNYQYVPTIGALIDQLWVREPRPQAPPRPNGEAATATRCAGGTDEVRAQARRRTQDSRFSADGGTPTRLLVCCPVAAG
jgi:peptide/nickel transport system substrate-binding protein